MGGLKKKDEKNNKVSKLRTFPIPSSLLEIKENITFTTSKPLKPSKETITNQALNLHLQGKILQAADCYLQIINQGCKDYKIFSNYGAILIDLEKFKEAEISIRKAIELKPNLSEAHYNLGLLLKSLGNLKEAEISTRKAIELKPDYAEAYSNLGIILKAFGKIEEAKKLLKKAIKLKPSYESYFAYASCLFKKKRFNSSIENLEKAKKLTEEKSLYIITEISLAISKLNKKELDQSISYEEKKILSDRIIDRLIVNREVEDELLDYLFTIKTNQLNESKDSRYGKGECSDFLLFEDPSPIITKLSTDIEDICKKELGLKEIFIFDSFFNIFISGSGQPPHRHLNLRDIDFNLSEKKYSLVYYLDIGDQDVEEPGILKLHQPEENILPTKGMIVIIGADRYHSVVYKGNKKRVMVGVNFYGL